MQKQNRPDMDQAAKFLEKLDPKATSWTFQTFDDNADRKAKHLVSVLNGTLGEHWQTLCDMSARGAGVFVTINRTDLKGRKKENVLGVRAVFVDTDGADHAPIVDAKPNIIVESSPGNFHDYWLVDGCPKEDFEPAQRAMIAAWGTDKSVHDLPRVMRLPGFPHQKVDSKKGLTGEPFMVRMNEGLSFFEADDWAHRKAAIAALAPAETLSQRALRNAQPPSGQGWADTALCDELSKLLATPEGQRNDALNKAAYNLGQIVAGGALDQADVIARLTAAAQGIGLCAGEIAPTIQSGLAAGLQTPRGPKEQADQTKAQTQIRHAADPVDLWGSFDPPELPQGLLPRLIEDFAHANGAQMGADPAGLAVAALVTCAAAIPDKIKIKVKRHADWTESARIWAAAMGPPSAKKSPIISAATGPLCKLDGEMMRAWQKKVQEYEALPKDEKKGRQRPPQTRLRLGDTTIEAAQGVMEGSPWGVLLLQDELSGFFGAMDKYNGGKGASADRAVWLQSYNGGEYSLNRVSRGAVLIENLSVCMLGGIQPEPMRKIAGDAVDDGLLQRLFVITLRNATMGTDEPMPPVNADYSALVRHLHNLKPPGWMGQGVLEFDDEAQAIRHDLEAKHLELQSVETINRKLASHIGKFDGVFARLCVLWHCIEHIESTMLCDTPDFDGTTLPATVTGATAQRVADFLHRFLLAHSIAFYSGVLGLSDDHDRLTAIAGHILAHKLDRITNRDVQRGDRTMRGLKDFEIRPLLEQLAALGWLDRIDPPRPSSAPHWQVNPAVHVRFEKRGRRENDRRRQARETIQSLAGAIT